MLLREPALRARRSGALELVLPLQRGARRRELDLGRARDPARAAPRGALGAVPSPRPRSPAPSRRRSRRAAAATPRARRGSRRRSRSSSGSRRTKSGARSTRSTDSSPARSPPGRAALFARAHRGVGAGLPRRVRGARAAAGSRGSAITCSTRPPSSGRSSGSRSRRSSRAALWREARGRSGRPRDVSAVRAARPSGHAELVFSAARPPRRPPRRRSIRSSAARHTEARIESARASAPQ